MGINYGSVGAGALSGAAAGASLGSVVPGIGNLTGAAVGTIGGALLGGASGMLSNTGNSANVMSMQDMYNLEMYNTMKDLYFMNQQNQYNQANMRYSNELAKDLQNQQFEHNKWFVQNAYQNTVNDLRSAGLNPLLAVQNGANTGSVSPASGPSAGAVSSTGHGIDPSSMLSASANSANAKIAKSQLALNALNAVSDIGVKLSTSAKQSEEAVTQRSVQDINKTQVFLNTIESFIKRVELRWKNDEIKSDIISKLRTSEATLMEALIKRTKMDSEIELNRSLSRYYNKTGEANWITATQGNLEKALIDLITGMLHDDPKGIGEKVGDKVGEEVDKEIERMNSGPNDFDQEMFYKIYKGLGLDKYGVSF